MTKILIEIDADTQRVVPVEPTDEMICAAMDAEDAKPLSDWGKIVPITYKETYAAMLAAAPQPELVDVGSVGWKHDCAALCANDIELWIDRCPHCGKPRHNHPPTDDELLNKAEQVESEPVAEHELQDTRCECCGYMTYHREHMGCIRSSMPQPDRVTTKESYVELDIHSNPSRTEQQRKLDGSLEVGQLLGNGQNQETSHSKTVGDILLADAFRGDAANLIESIVALVSLDRAGVLVPHGIGGHARSLLESAAIRLSQPDRVAELEAALKVARDALDHARLFIRNGIGLGYIRMPDDDCPDPAKSVPGEIFEALAKINEVLKP